MVNFHYSQRGLPADLLSSILSFNLRQSCNPIGVFFADFLLFYGKACFCDLTGACIKMFEKIK